MIKGALFEWIVLICKMQQTILLYYSLHCYLRVKIHGHLNSQSHSHCILIKLILGKYALLVICDKNSKIMHKGYKIDINKYSLKDKCECIQQNMIYYWKYSQQLRFCPRKVDKHFFFL